MLIFLEAFFWLSTFLLVAKFVFFHLQFCLLIHRILLTFLLSLQQKFQVVHRMSLMLLLLRHHRRHLGIGDAGIQPVFQSLQVVLGGDPVGEQACIAAGQHFGLRGLHAGGRQLLDEFMRVEGKRGHAQRLSAFISAGKASCRCTKKKPPPVWRGLCHSYVRQAV